MVHEFKILQPGALENLPLRSQTFVNIQLCGIALPFFTLISQDLNSQILLKANTGFLELLRLHRLNLFLHSFVCTHCGLATAISVVCAGRPCHI